MSIGVSVRTTNPVARNNGIGVRQESNPQSPTAYSSERYRAFKDNTTLRQIAYILTFILSILLIACGQTKTKSVGDKQDIELATIDNVELRKHQYQKDSLNINLKLLNGEQSKWLVDKWNNAKSKGLCKYIPIYWLTIHFKDGSKRTFIINGQSIKESNDYCFDLGDNLYLEIGRAHV